MMFSTLRFKSKGSFFFSAHTHQKDYGFSCATLSGTVRTCQELIMLVLRSYMPVCTAGFGALDILNQLRWVFFQVNNKKEVPFANYPYGARVQYCFSLLAFFSCTTRST